MNTLKVNGTIQQFGGTMPATVSELLLNLGVDEATVVAEIDGEIIERKNFSKTRLSDGQQIELIRFVGGG
jgi:sulfur carrier protein